MDTDDELVAWRAYVLRRVYLGLLVIGPVPVAYMWTVLAPSLLFRVALTGMSAIVLVGAWLSSDPRRLIPLGWLLVVGIIVACGIGLTEFGAAPGGMLGLAATVVFAGIVLDRRLIWYLAIGEALLLLGTGAAMHAGWIATPDPRVVFNWGSMGTWVRITSSTFIGTVVLASALSNILLRFEQGLRDRSDALRRVEWEEAERRVADERRRIAEAALVRAQKMELVGRVAAGVAHNINNSLCVILAWTDLLRARTLEAPKYKEAIESMATAAQNAAQVTRQLVTTARRDARALGPTDVGQALLEIGRTCERAFPADTRVRSEIGDVPRVMVGEAQLQQVLLNLALNARDAMPKGGELLLACRRADKEDVGDLGDGEYVAIRMSDNGTGMDESTRRRLFEPFFTTKGEGRGSGLGLASSLAIVEQAGGRIRVETSAGGGSTFSVVLPVARDGGAVRESVRIAVRPASPGAIVLLVEDDQALRTVLGLTLRSAGYEVIESRDAEHAIELARRQRAPIDVLCCDGILPDGGSQRVIAEVRALHPRSRTLVFSGHIDELTLSQRLGEGTYTFLAKPFSGPELLQKVADELDLARG